VLATRDLHVAMAEGNTLYARGFSTPTAMGTHYNFVRVGDACAIGHIASSATTASSPAPATSRRVGDPVTLIMTESSRETEEGDKLFAGGADVPLDFIPARRRSKSMGASWRYRTA